ncbi:unnamed protein product, partial [Meganyctiphanes norvegica]
GIPACAHMEIGAKSGTSVGLALKQADQVSSTKLLRMGHLVPVRDSHRVISVGSSSEVTVRAPSSHGIRWTTEDFIKAHKEVRRSGRYNFEGCRIPIPTSIRY